jgi:hypothetical protein
MASRFIVHFRGEKSTSGGSYEGEYPVVAETASEAADEYRKNTGTGENIYHWSYTVTHVERDYQPLSPHEEEQYYNKKKKEEEERIRLQNERKKRDYERALADLDEAKPKVNASFQTSKDFVLLSEKFSRIAQVLQSLSGSFEVQAQIEECENCRKQCEEKRIEQERIEQERRVAQEKKDRERQRIEKEKREADERARKKRRKITMAVLIAAIGISAGYIAYNSQQNSVTIPNGVTIIKEGEFARKQLVSIEIPHSVTSIGNNAFKRNKLTSVAIPDSVTSIGESAFASNWLTSITIGSKVTIGGDAFGSGFETAYSNNGMGAGTYKRFDKNSWDWRVWHGNFEYQNHSGNIAIIGYDGIGSEVVIPASINENPVTIIKSNAFNGKNLSSVTIPNSVTSIEINAFTNNRVTSIRIGANVKLAEEPGANGAGVLGRRTGFNTAYANSGKKAGTFTRPSTNSTTLTRR